MAKKQKLPEENEEKETDSQFDSAAARLVKRFLLPLDLLFLKLPFAVSDSRVANLIVLSNCTKRKVEMITVQGSSVKQWVQAQYTGLVSWVIIST